MLQKGCSYAFFLCLLSDSLSVQTAESRFQYFDGIDKQRPCLGGRTKLRVFWVYLRLTTTVDFLWSVYAQTLCALCLWLDISVFFDMFFRRRDLLTGVMWKNELHSLLSGCIFWQVMEVPVSKNGMFCGVSSSGVPDTRDRLWCVWTFGSPGFFLITTLIKLPCPSRNLQCLPYRSLLSRSRGFAQTCCICLTA